MQSLAAACALAASVGNAHAIVITADTSATSLANAVTAGAGLTIVGTPTLSGQSSGGAVSSGTYTNASGTYSIGGGIVISSGDVNDYNDGPSTSGSKTTSYGGAATPGQEALLDPITGGGKTHYDVTQLDLSFTTTTGSVFFNVVFGSDEFAEYKNTTYIDAFGIYLNGFNIAFFNTDPINIDHPQMAFRAGTELDGVLPGTGGPMLFSGAGLSTTAVHTLTFTSPTRATPPTTARRTSRSSVGSHRRRRTGCLSPARLRWLASRSRRSALCAVARPDRAVRW